MAIDGIKIIDSDLAYDIQNKILNLYNEQKSEQEIKLYLKSELLKLGDSLSVEIFLTSSCFVLWEIGMLNRYFLEQLEKSVNNGADIFWRNSFDVETYEKRNNELDRLLAKVREPNKRIRRRKRYKELLNTLFSKGDILAVNIENQYRCIIFENFYQYRNDAYYSFVVTTYDSNVAPAPDDILLEEIPVTKTKMKDRGIRALDIHYKFVEKYRPAFIKVGKMYLDSKTERLGFSRQANGIKDLTDLKGEMEDILLGEKVELHVCYSFS